MSKETYIKLDPLQTREMIEKLSSHMDIIFEPEKTVGMVYAPPFYDGYNYVELTRHDIHPPITRRFIMGNGGNVTPLNWTNEPIYRLNKTAPIKLNDQTSPDYVRFFFTHVRGSHGRFLIIDTVDDIDWREEPAPSGRKALGKMIAPVQLKEKLTDGTMVYTVSIVFKDSLFAASAHLKPDGNIVLSDEELLVEDIPVADDLFGQ